jgi:glycosyltransferase involved in cell wall biosynthesis
MHLPKVSVGMPVFNGEKFLRFAIDGLLKQEFTDFELIISDNASSDRTRDICEEYAAKDSRIRYYRNETNIGASGNYRRVFELARAELFAWAAHDDVHLPGFLRRCVEVLDQTPSQVVLVAPRTEIIDDQGRRTGKMAETLHTKRSLPHQRVADVLRNVAWAAAQFGLFRVQTLRQTRLIDPFLASDWVLLLELAILGEIWEIPEVLFQRRDHAGMSTIANRTQADLIKWFDTSSRKSQRNVFSQMKLPLQPRTRLAIEYGRSIARLPLPPMERFCCFNTAFGIWLQRELHRLGGEYGSRIRDRFIKTFGLFWECRG